MIPTSASGSDDALAHELMALAAALVPAGIPRPEAARVVEIAARAVPHAEHAGLTMIRGNKPPRTAAASSEVPTTVDQFQYETGEGPCLEAIESSDIAIAADLATDDQWPKFARRTVEATPIRSMFGVRLFLSGDERAALNFYSSVPGAFTDRDIAVAAILSSYASLSLERDSAQNKVDNLETALSSSRQIGTALGILMARELMTSEQAFEALRAASQQLHRKLRDIADEVVRTGELPQDAGNYTGS